MVDISEGVVTRARLGDVDAFRTILEAFEAPIYQTVFRMVGGRFPSDVEDITQEVFLKVFRSLNRFDPDRGVKFSTWIYTFVKNHCFDVLKKRRLNTVLYDTTPAEGREGARFELPAGDAHPALDALQGELNHQISEAVSRLPDEQRLVFILREYQQLDYREISEVLACSEGTVKSRLYRAKEALRQSLRRYVLQ